MKLESNIPKGPLAEKWENHKFSVKLVNPSNKRKFKVIVVGTGLAGASAAATLAELGYQVTAFTYHDSPRRAHSIAAQGGINAAKNYQNDGDSVMRLFYDTIKGGDFRAREANVHRLAEVSLNIIDQCVAQGVPFAREYGGYLDNRSFGGAQVSRTFYARGQTGQQLLLGAYSALSRQIGAKKVESLTRREVLDIVMINGHAKGVIVKNLINGEIERHAADAVLLCTGGYGNVYFLSTNAMHSNGSAAWRAHRRGAAFANPCFVQIHPTCIPVSGHYQSKLTLMSESLRNDGRVWVPKTIEVAKAVREGRVKAQDVPEADRDYFLERRYPSFGNLAPRDVSSRNAKYVCDEGRSIIDGGEGVFLDFADAIKRLGKSTVEARYGNLFEMYQRITDDNPYETPMKIFPAVHYTMGGLWVDYNLQTTIPGLFALGEANFSDHGANRLGASALMQGLADGYFVIPFTLGNYLAGQSLSDHPTTEHPAFAEAEEGIRAEIAGYFAKRGGERRSVDSFHQQLGKLMWDYCGMARTGEGLRKAQGLVRQLREDFHHNVVVPGSDGEFNPELQKAWRMTDYLELGELMINDALHREESCGGHLREEYQTEDGEASRRDELFAYVAAWEYQGYNQDWILHKEQLEFENVKLSTRSYK
ncbi:MAG: fumarate reductase/succinate dehydrogenase flavoprotein subunit [Bacteroidia bacterium]|nr:fumarate reductase/succinate dehydrogenase flavoprotein subunit [Bacteroidia bacterium]